MKLPVPRVLGRRTIRRVDAALVVWAIVWIGIAAYTALEVNGLEDLSGTVVKTGVAVDTTGRALENLAQIPIVGVQISTLADQVRAAGQSAVVSGRSSHQSIANLSILLGVAIGLIPTVPALAIWLPFRLRWRRERRALEQARRTHAGEPAFEEFLARRAVQHLPFDELRGISKNPWRDLEAERYRPLANAELARLGLPSLADAPAGV